jgi:GT2 family glycosyltransferase/glycosyltransferase involved in cell wall biosynthesis
MHWFLKTFILPLLDALRPAVIVEVGVELGTVTEPLLDWAQANGAVLHSIDPNPKLEVDELLARHAERLRFHRAPSLQALPGIQNVDLALIDGDHNWYTVINELRLLARRAQEDGRRAPVTLLHDIGWPYGRRDLYYDPATIPARRRQPHARQGVLPGQAELDRLGVNPHLENARLEGTPANGVLTAVEDFIAESPAEWRFHSIPGLSGLGVLLTAGTLDGEESEPLRRLLESIEHPAFLRAQCEAIEDARVESEVRRAQLQLRLSEMLARDERQQSALARAGVEMEAADEERQALERRLRMGAAEADRQAAEQPPREPIVEPAATEAEASTTGGAGAGELTTTPAEQDLAATRTERDELAHALARLQAPARGEASWARELELRGQQAFLDAYLRVLAHCAPSPDERDPLSIPFPFDRLNLLCAEGEPQELAHPTVDVVVCVRDALADVRRCLASLLDATGRRFRLVVVDDGSDAPTRAFLADFAARHPAVTLVRREESPHGYTLAANAGLRACASDYVVLLNSDTLLTPGWLQRLVDHGERHPQLGILGPLSNAASHQSVPELRDGGAWATNPLPDWLTVEGMARIVQAAPRVDARLPFVNGFCYVIKRAVLDSIGLFDEERFAEGYCEENDYSHRAYKRGFHLGVATDAYVHHAKSRSYGGAGRDELAKAHYQVFLDKHDREELQELVAAMESSTALAPVRRAVAEASAAPRAMAALLGGEGRRPLEVVFVLPGLADGGSGGSHSIYQEVRGMRALGLPARIALHADAWPRAQAAYEDAAEVFEVFSDVDDLAAHTASADVIAATHFKSVALLCELRQRREDFLPAYYVQDYEPFFTAPESEDLQEALASYTALPDLVPFAKTHWLCNVVGVRHGIPVHRVEPSIDERLFFPAPAASGAGDTTRPLPPLAAEDPGGGERPATDARGERPATDARGERPATDARGERPATDARGERPATDARGERPLRVLAMIRPRTPRRQPAGTVAVLERLLSELPERVEVRTFGCRHAELARLTRSRALLTGHLGVLSRAAVAAQLRQTDVFLDMSTYQAFGRSALEAMACGATAVVPQLGGAWEFVEHDLNALAVDTLDSAAVFEAVALLADDRERLERMGAASLDTASRFSVVRASLSEYLLFERLHRQRFGPGERAPARAEGQPPDAPAAPVPAHPGNQAAASYEEDTVPFTTPTIPA